MQSLVLLLGEFGVSESSARAAVHRSAARGVLEGSKRGRNAYYCIRPETRLGMADAAYSFLVNESDEWDGDWTVLLFRLGTGNRDSRHAVYQRLRSYGFGPLYDGAWISPQRVADDVARAMDELGAEDFVLFRAREPLPFAGRDVLSAWDLDGLAGRYRAFIAEFSPVRDWVDAGAVTAAEALVARVRLMDEWRSIPESDPGLPAKMLPPDWPRADAFALFGHIYDALGPLAVQRVRQLVARDEPRLARLVSEMTVNELVATARAARHGHVMPGEQGSGGTPE